LSLYARLTLALFVSLSIAYGAWGFVQLKALDNALRGEVDKTLALRAVALEAEIRPILSHGLSTAALRDVHLNPDPLQAGSAPDVFVQICDTSGKILAMSDNLRRDRLPIPKSGLSEQRYETVSLKPGSEIRLLTVPLLNEGQTIAYLVVAESLRLVSESLKSAAQYMTVYGVVVLLLTQVIVVSLLASGLAPMTSVARTAEAIVRTGDMSRRVPLPRGRDEPSQIAEAFNTVVERVDGLLQAQARLLADTSHELRNPLTVLRTDLDLLKRDLDSTMRAEVGEEAEREADRMARLVDELLLLSTPKIESTLRHEPLSLAEVAVETVRSFQKVAGERRLSVDVDPDAWVLGDGDRLRQILRNLLDNAVRYTSPQGRIRVTVVRKRGHSILTVEDDGVGIPAADLPHVFDRFYRVDPARSRQSGGTGLGLSIVRALVEGHGGTVRAAQAAPHGAIFEVTLPASPS